MELHVQRKVVSASAHQVGKEFVVTDRVTQTTTEKIAPNDVIVQMEVSVIQLMVNVHALLGGMVNVVNENVILVDLGKTARRSVIAIWKIYWPAMRPPENASAKQIGAVFVARVNVHLAITASRATRSVRVTTIRRAIRIRATASAPGVGLVRLVMNHARKVSSGMDARNVAQFQRMVIRPVITSLANILAGRVTLERLVSTPALRVLMDRNVGLNVPAGMEANAPMKRECANVPLGGQGPTVKRCVRTASTDQTVAKNATARIRLNVGKTTVNVSVIPAGWGTDAMRCVQKDFTEITVWSRATVQLEILSVMQQRAACVAWAIAAISVTNLVLSQKFMNLKTDRTLVLPGVLSWQLFLWVS